MASQHRYMGTVLHHDIPGAGSPVLKEPARPAPVPGIRVGTGIEDRRGGGMDIRSTSNQQLAGEATGEGSSIHPSIPVPASPRRSGVLEAGPRPTDGEPPSSPSSVSGQGEGSVTSARAARTPVILLGPPTRMIVTPALPPAWVTAPWQLYDAGLSAFVSAWTVLMACTGLLQRMATAVRGQELNWGQWRMNVWTGMRTLKVSLDAWLHRLGPPGLPWWTWLALPFSLGLIKRKHTATIGRLDVTVVEAEQLVPMEPGGARGASLRASLWSRMTGRSGRGASTGITTPGTGPGAAGNSAVPGGKNASLASSLLREAEKQGSESREGQGVCHPFVEVAVGQHVIASSTSAVVRDTVCPHWDETFAFRVYSAYTTLRVTVWHAAGPKGKQPLGEVVLPAALWADEKEHAVWCNLRPCGAPPGDKGVREIARATDSALGTRIQDVTETILCKGSTAAIARAQLLATQTSPQDEGLPLARLGAGEGGDRKERGRTHRLSSWMRNLSTHAARGTHHNNSTSPVPTPAGQHAAACTESERGSTGMSWMNYAGAWLFGAAAGWATVPMPRKSAAIPATSRSGPRVGVPVRPESDRQRESARHRRRHTVSAIDGRENAEHHMSRRHGAHAPASATSSGARIWSLPEPRHVGALPAGERMQEQDGEADTEQPLLSPLPIASEQDRSLRRVSFLSDSRVRPRRPATGSPGPNAIPVRRSHTVQARRLSGGDWFDSDTDDEAGPTSRAGAARGGGTGPASTPPADRMLAQPPSLSERLQSPTARAGYDLDTQIGSTGAVYQRDAPLAADTELVPPSTCTAAGASAGSMTAAGKARMPAPVLVSDGIVHDYGLGRIHLRIKLQYDPLAEFWSHWLHVESRPPRLRPPFSAPLLIHNLARLYEALVQPLLDVVIHVIDLLTWNNVSNSVAAVLFLLCWSWWPPLGAVTGQLTLLTSMVREYVRWRLALTARRLREKTSPPLPIPAPICTSAAVVLPPSMGPQGDVSLPSAVPVSGHREGWDTGTRQVMVQPALSPGQDTSEQSSYAVPPTDEGSSTSTRTGGLRTGMGWEEGLLTSGGIPTQGEAHAQSAAVHIPEGASLAGAPADSGISIALAPSAASGKLPCITMTGEPESPLRALGAWRQVQVVWGIVINWLLARVHDTSSSNASFVQGPRTRAETREEARRRWYHLDPDGALVTEAHIVAAEAEAAAGARPTTSSTAAWKDRVRIPSNRLFSRGTSALQRGEPLPPTEAGSRALVVQRGDMLVVTALGDTLSSISDSVSPRTLGPDEVSRQDSAAQAEPSSRSGMLWHRQGMRMQSTAEASGATTVIAVPYLISAVHTSMTGQSPLQQLLQQAVALQGRGQGARGPPLLSTTNVRPHPTAGVGHTRRQTLLERFMAELLPGEDRSSASLWDSQQPASAAASRALAHCGSVIRPLTFIVPSTARIVCLNANTLLHDSRALAKHDAVLAWLQRIGYDPHRRPSAVLQSTSSVRPGTGVQGPGGQPSGAAIGDGWVGVPHSTVPAGVHRQSLQQAAEHISRAGKPPAAALQGKKGWWWKRLFRPGSGSKEAAQPGSTYGGRLVETRVAMRRPAAEEEEIHGGPTHEDSFLPARPVSTGTSLPSSLTQRLEEQQTQVMAVQATDAVAGQSAVYSVPLDVAAVDAQGRVVPSVVYGQAWVPGLPLAPGWYMQGNNGYAMNGAIAQSTRPVTGTGSGGTTVSSVGSVTGTAAHPDAPSGGLAVSTQVQEGDDLARVIALATAQIARLRDRRPRPAAEARMHPHTEADGACALGDGTSHYRTAAGGDEGQMDAGPGAIDGVLDGPGGGEAADTTAVASITRYLYLAAALSDHVLPTTTGISAALAR